MVDYRTLILIGVCLAVVFFGTRFYYETKLKHLMNVHNKADEIIGEIIPKYMELIAMNFALTTKLQRYEEMCGEITEEEIKQNETKASMVKDKINAISELVKHPGKG